jgi:hypothetical protein
MPIADDFDFVPLFDFLCNRNFPVLSISTTGYLPFQRVTNVAGTTDVCCYHHANFGDYV